MSDIPTFAEAVRRRPGMYIGPPDNHGMWRLLDELLRPVLDAGPGLPCAHIQLTLRPDDVVALEHDGDLSGLTGLALPASFTPLALEPAVTRWKDTLYTAVLNAVSDELTLELWGAGRHAAQVFRRGRPVAPVQERDAGAGRGCRITFRPDRSIWTELERLSAYALLGHLRSLAALHPGLRVSLHDERDQAAWTLVYQDGLRSYLEEQDYTYDDRCAPRLRCRLAEGEIAAEAVLHWHAEGPALFESYVNGRRTPGGGSHAKGLRRGLARALDSYARAKGLFLPGTPRLRARHLPPGLAAVVSVIYPQVSYAGSLRDRVADPVVEEFVRDMLEAQIPEQLAAFQARQPHTLDRWLGRWAERWGE
jgi:DNA gyrase subunit B